MPEVRQGKSVIDCAIERITSVYEGGHRAVVAYSAGKDSTVVLELTIEVARKFGKLPVDVSFFDEEIFYPGTTELVEETRKRPEVNLRWVSNHSPHLNAFSREAPYWWQFDPELSPEQWVRKPPSDIFWLEDHEMKAATKAELYPPPPGKDLVVFLGIRAAESRNRRMSMFSSGGFLAKTNEFGHRPARPIFDWKDSDVWKAISDNGWPFNSAYNVMHRFGISRNRMRVGPPTMTAASIIKLQMAAKAWPQWFAKISARLSGVRTAAAFGRRAITPQRRLHETWKQCFERTCIKDAPAWISERATKYAELRVRQHKYHANEDLPDAFTCATCYCNGSWKALCMSMYMGDPFSLKDGSLPRVEPERFRAGTGKWWEGRKKA